MDHKSQEGHKRKSTSDVFNNGLLFFFLAFVECGFVLQTVTGILMHYTTVTLKRVASPLPLSF